MLDACEGSTNDIAQDADCLAFAASVQDWIVMYLKTRKFFEVKSFKIQWIQRCTAPLNRLELLH